MIWVQSYQQKNSQNSDKVLRFLKISTYIFSNCVPIKIFLRKFSEICPLAAPKYFVWKFLIFWKKLVGSKFPDFCLKISQKLRFLLVGLSPGIQMVRQKGNHLKTGKIVPFSNRVGQNGCHFVFGLLENLTGSPFRSIKVQFSNV